jgi:ParB-like chromosome segregation protein Spo0J
MSPKLKFLLAFAERGVGILPLTPGDNAPAVAGGAKAAVTDPKTLRAFYKKRARYNYGLALGDGVFAVRVNDSRSKSRLHKLAAEHGERLPRTVTIRVDTARLYLFAAKGMQVSTGLIEKGIDVLGTGEYVPGPGSRLPSGGESRFALDRSLSDVEIASASAWLLQLIAAVPTDPTDGGGTTVKEPAGTSGGDGNSVRSPEKQLISIPVSAILVDAARQLDLDHVRLLEDSIEILGLRTPITVMRRKGSGNTGGPVTFDLLTGHARLNAMRNRGASWVDVFVFDGDETDAKLWAIAENVDRRVLSVIEEAERTAEFDRLLDAKLDKVVQDAPPGGVQPADKGLRKAAKRLRISREQMRRRRLVSGLSAEAKTEAKRLGLEGNQSALLDAAKEKTPEDQVAKLRERAAARKGAPRRKNGRRKKKQHAAERDDMVPAAEVKRLKNQLAEAAERQRELEEELETARKMARPAVEKAAPTTDEDIPPFLDRRPLSSDDQKILDDTEKAWDEHVQPLWANASPLVRERFRASRITGTSG